MQVDVPLITLIWSVGLKTPHTIRFAGDRKPSTNIEEHFGAGLNVLFRSAGRLQSKADSFPLSGWVWQQDGKMLDGRELLLGARARGGGRQRHSQPDLPAALRRTEPLARRAKPKAQKCVTDPS